MAEIGIRELKQRTSEILRHVREEKESISITYRGRVVARLVPVDKVGKRARDTQVWTDMDELAAEIGDRWPVGVTAVEAVQEQRRDG